MELEHQIIDNNGEYLNFRDDIMQRIRSAQYEAMRAVNKEMISLYWDIGRQITERQKELGWGKSVVENLSKDIQKEFPGIQGFGVSNLRDMARFYTEYQSNAILQPWLEKLVGLKMCFSIRLKPKHSRIICLVRAIMTKHCLRLSPIGVATYSISSELPEQYKEMLPASQDIAIKVDHLLNQV